jgi:hypothetical protein
MARLIAAPRPVTFLGSRFAHESPTANERHRRQEMTAYKSRLRRQRARLRRKRLKQKARAAKRPTRTTR